MISFLRKLFGLCDHEWKAVKNVQLNQFENGDDLAAYDPNDYEIVSSRDFVKQECTKCGNFRFRKN